MKKNLNKEKSFFSWKINKALSRVNNLMIVLVLVVYVALFAVGISFIKAKESNTLLLPEDNNYDIQQGAGNKEYTHLLYNNEINCYFEVIAQRTYNSENDETINYSFKFCNDGKYIDGSDPGYRISSYYSRAGMVSTLDSTNVEDVYYFNEINDVQTSISHRGTINGNNNKNNPLTVFTRIVYRSSGEDKVLKLKEKIQLLPTEEDITRLNNVYNNVIKVKNNEYDLLDPDSSEAIEIKKSVYALNITNITDQRIGVAEVMAKRDATEGSNKYNVTFRMEMVDKDVIYHNDAQIWIETESGDYLPYMGVYGFGSDHAKYNSSSYSLYDQTKCKYLCMKVISYDLNGDYTISYYKQELTRLETETGNFNVSNQGITNSYKK